MEVANMRQHVRDRITGYYNWDWITEFYEDLFFRMVRRQPVISYEAFCDRSVRVLPNEIG